jgi:hypothetical protein
VPADCVVFQDLATSPDTWTLHDRPTGTACEAIPADAAPPEPPLFAPPSDPPGEPAPVAGELVHPAMTSANAATTETALIERMRLLLRVREAGHRLIGLTAIA